MKKQTLVYSSILVIVILISIVAFSKHNDEEVLITKFIESYFTNDDEDVNLYENYFTKEGFENFKTNRHLTSRTPQGNSNHKFNTEIKDLDIKNVTKSDSDMHSYDITFTLINKDTNKEVIVNHTINLSEENKKWKLNFNRIDQLTIPLTSILQ
ncbi:MAG: hypothetical protein RSA29_14800 [Clostridium sp.]|uniref:hypothetical protein n=1 Tax=Clostridium sp. TaxID=1506 RepID=UPI0032166F19